MAIHALPGGGGFALDRQNLCWRLPFENSLSPTLAKGSTNITYTAGSKEDVAFAPGLRGLALQAKAGLGLQYASQGMFAAKEGTVAVWVRPVGWNKGDGCNHVFLRCCGDVSSFMLYKFYPGNTWVYLEGPGKTGVVGGWWDEWEEGKWTFLASPLSPVSRPGTSTANSRRRRPHRAKVQEKLDSANLRAKRLRRPDDIRSRADGARGPGRLSGQRPANKNRYFM